MVLPTWYLIIQNDFTCVGKYLEGILGEAGYRTDYRFASGQVSPT
jgi:hypothetical protein